MTVNINEIVETDYTVYIDVPEEKQEELFKEMSCAPCMDSILDMESFLEDKGLAKDIDFEISDGREFSRIEMWQ